MTMTRLAASIFITSSLLLSTASYAQTDVTDVIIPADTISVADTATAVPNTSPASRPVSPQPVESAFARHFAWGASLGSSIDMTGQDMTAVDIDAFFGYKGDYIRFAGMGAGIRMMVSNSSRSYPVYAMLRTSFTKSPSFLYLELKGGVGFTNLYTDIYQRNFVGGITIGFTLAHSRTFSSNFSLGYEYMPLSNGTIDGVDTRFSDLHYASIRIGASF